MQCKVLWSDSQTSHTTHSFNGLVDQQEEQDSQETCALPFTQFITRNGSAVKDYALCNSWQLNTHSALKEIKLTGGVFTGMSGHFLLL